MLGLQKIIADTDALIKLKIKILKKILMPGANYIVFKNLRPPVAIDENGTTPLRTKSGRRTFSLGNGNYQDKNGFKISKEAIVKN